MIITAIDFPILSNRAEQKDAQLAKFVGSAGLLTTLLLRIPSNYNYDDDSIRLLLELCESTPCNAYGFTVDDDEIVTRLLDNGLQLAYFNINTINNEEKELLNKVLKTFPRSRVGIYINNSNNSNNSDNSQSLDNVRLLVEEYSEIVSNFTFK